MSDTEIKAAEARRLSDDLCFQEIMGEIEASAVAVFQAAHSTPEQILAAHEKVRAVDVIRNAITARIDSATFEQRKNQHRGND